MQDKYYSDKNPKSQSDGREKYTKADYFDENFSLKFKKTQGNAQSFRKNEAIDDESFTSFARNSDAEDIDSLFGEGTARRPVQSAGREVHASSCSRVSAPDGRVSGSSVRPVGNVVPSRVPSGRPVEAAAVKKRKKKKKKSKAALAFKIIVSVLLVLIIGTGSLVFYLLNSIDKALEKGNYDTEIIDNRYLSTDAPVSEEIINILLIGSDKRPEGSSVTGQRSDTMILLTVDSKNKQIKLTSFLRDSYVYIPSLGKKSKMNASYSNDGAQGVMDTIEYNFGIDVHDYISVDFEAFEKIIDILGGVTVKDVTEKEAKYMNREADTDIKAGSNHMNGYEALWYCRIRKLDSDFYRTQRQRKVLSAVIDKLKTDPDKLLDILDKVMPYVTTSISKKEIKSMGVDALTYINYEVLQQQIPADGTWRDGSVNGSYVIEFDIAENKELLQDFVYLKGKKTEK